MATLIPSITNTSGERLGARLDLPLEGRPLAYAIFAHCLVALQKTVESFDRAIEAQKLLNGPHMVG